MKIIADASLPKLKLFEKNFILDVYHNIDELKIKIAQNDILLCRSTTKVDKHLLHNTNIKCVASASSGTNHIDLEYLRTKNITLLDAKGANADAVADYIISVMALLSNTKKLTDAHIGIIGLGEVGSRIAMRLNLYGFKVSAFDPFINLSNLKPYIIKNTNNQQNKNNKITHNNINLLNSLNEIFNCNVISVHANLHNDAPFATYNLLNANFFNNLTSDSTIINAARGEIVDELALLNNKKNLCYCTDVYQNEPKINPLIVDYATVCTPHIAGHSIEGKENAVILVGQKLHKHYKKPQVALNYDNDTLKTPFFDISNWQDYALSLYNPIIETLELKNSNNKEEAFLKLRSMHKNRHDFSFYK